MKLLCLLALLPALSWGCIDCRFEIEYEIEENNAYIKDNKLSNSEYIYMKGVRDGLKMALEIIYEHGCGCDCP